MTRKQQNHALRQRKVAVDTNLQVVRLPKDPKKVGEEFQEVYDIFNEDQKEFVKKDIKAIPVPKIAICETPAQRHGRARFNLPEHYIKYSGCTGAKLITSKHDLYDLRQEDVEWLNHHLNPPPGYRPVTYSELKMAQVILHYEQQAFKRGGSIVDVLCHYSPKQACNEVQMMFDTENYSANLLYHYWRQKRVRLQKPLMRKFQPPPEIGNEDPNIPFRSRDMGNKKMTTRRNSRSVRKQQDENLSRIQDFQIQMREALSLLHEVQNRMLVKSEKHRKQSDLIKTYLLSQPWGKALAKTATNPKGSGPKFETAKNMYRLLKTPHQLRSRAPMRTKNYENLHRDHMRFNPSELWQISWHDLEIEMLSEDEETPCPDFYEKLDVFEKMEIRKFMYENKQDGDIVKNIGFKFNIQEDQAKELYEWYKNSDQDEKEFFERLEKENRLTRKERINEILNVNPDSYATRSVYSQRPSRLGRVAFDVIVVDDSMQVDEELENIQPLGTKLEILDKKRNNIFRNCEI